MEAIENKSMGLKSSVLVKKSSELKIVVLKSELSNYEEVMLSEIYKNVNTINASLAVACDAGLLVKIVVE